MHYLLYENSSCKHQANVQLQLALAQGQHELETLSWGGLHQDSQNPHTSRKSSWNTPWKAEKASIKCYNTDSQLVFQNANFFFFFFWGGGGAWCCLYWPDNHLRHLFGCSEPLIVDSNDGNDSGDVLYELLIGSMEVFQVLQGDCWLALPPSQLNPSLALLWGDVQMNNQVRLFPVWGGRVKVWWEQWRWVDGEWGMEYCIQGLHWGNCLDLYWDLDSHEIGHVAEKRAIGFILSLFHHPRVFEHL